jgi:ribosomal protein S18 acetylase RimI-like enzyme
VIEGDVVMVGARSGIEYRHIRAEWADVLEELEHATFPTSNPDDLYDRTELGALARDFAEGCFVGFDGDEVVAMGIGIRTNFDLDHPVHRIGDVVPTDGTSGVVPDGRWYYGTTIAVKPSHRRMGIGNELYVLRKNVCRTLDLAGIVAGGVIPGFADHKHAMTADEYIDAVRRGTMVDPTLSFQLRNGFEAVCALPDYVDNPKVDGYAVLIVWHNPDHEGGS